MWHMDLTPYPGPSEYEEEIKNREAVAALVDAFRSIGGGATKVADAIRRGVIMYSPDEKSLLLQEYDLPDSL